MKTILKELDRLAKDRVIELSQAKKKGAKIVEWTGTFIPEEFIRAAGAETYILCRGGQPEPAEAVLDYMLRFMNPLARSLAGYNELNMDPITPLADLICTQQTDCHVGRVTELMEFKGYPINKVGVAADWKKAVAFEHYEESIHKMIEMVEGVTGQKMDEEKAKLYISKSNKINELLRKLNDLRKKDNPPIGLQEMIRLHHYSFIVDADVMIEKLTALYEKLENAPGKFADGAPRILAVGRAFAIDDYVIPRLFEENGGVIVAELMDECIRVTEADVELEGDIVHNFAKNRYLDKTPINIFQPAWRERFDKIMQLYKEYNCDGILWYQLSFDEIYDMEYSCIAQWLEKTDIPMMKLESSYEYSRENMGPLTTRIESYIKSLKEAK